MKQALNINIRDPKTNRFIPIPALTGESAYEIAKREGGFTGSEEEFGNMLARFAESYNDLIKINDVLSIDEMVHLSSEELSNKIPSAAAFMKLKNSIQVNTTAYWKKQDSFVPPLGTFIVYSDGIEHMINGEIKYLPAIKIGDGETLINDLGFFMYDFKLKHSISIGTTVFDGTKDVHVPVYDGTQI